MYSTEDYITKDGRCPIKEWLTGLPDRQARARISVRMQRLVMGNFGDCKAVRDGVLELRIDYGPGYRVYFSRIGKELLLLLAGGDKRKQRDDIDTAIDYLNEWNRRKTP
jgi:putative addiction module killer protein